MADRIFPNHGATGIYIKHRGFVVAEHDEFKPHRLAQVEEIHPFRMKKWGI